VVARKWWTHVHRKYGTGTNVLPTLAAVAAVVKGCVNGFNKTNDVKTTIGTINSLNFNINHRKKTTALSIFLFDSKFFLIKSTGD
jgi:hypothetical protein